jgi:DNA-binding transcriptional regulator YhcF (GntR family)
MQGKKNRHVTASAPVAISGGKWDAQPLDKSSFTPMYFQIQTQLLKMIQSGRLRAGDSLPSEEELSRIYGVSRMTSRQALQALKSQGFASRHKGQRSFVSQPRVEKDITHLCGFTAEMQALGIKATSRVLKAETVPATAEVAGQLGIAVHAPIFLLMRLRLADKLPVASPMTASQALRNLIFPASRSTKRYASTLEFESAAPTKSSRRARRRAAKRSCLRFTLGPACWSCRAHCGIRTGCPSRRRTQSIAATVTARCCTFPRPPSNSPGSEFCLQISLRPHNAWFEHHPYRRLDV